MPYIIAALVLFNFLTVFCGWRLAQVRRKRQCRASAYFHHRPEAVCYTPNWDRVVATRRIR